MPTVCLLYTSVVNAGVRFVFTDETAEGDAKKTEYYYEHGIVDYVEEIANLESITPVRFFQSEATGRDTPDRPEYKVKMSAAFCFSNKTQCIESVSYTHLPIPTRPTTARHWPWSAAAMSPERLRSR